MTAGWPPTSSPRKRNGPERFLPYTHICLQRVCLQPGKAEILWGEGTVPSLCVSPNTLMSARGRRGLFEPVLERFNVSIFSPQHCAEEVCTVSAVTLHTARQARLPKTGTAKHLREFASNTLKNVPTTVYSACLKTECCISVNSADARGSRIEKPRPKVWCV